MSARLFRFFACVPISGRAFLQEDYSIECWAGEYQAFSYYVLFFIGTFTFMFPAVLLFILMKHRKALHTPSIFARFGFLYSPFRQGCELWELHELTRKLLLTGIVVFFPPVSRAAVCIIVCMVNVATLAYFRPYHNSLVFAVELCSFLLTSLKVRYSHKLEWCACEVCLWIVLFALCFHLFSSSGF